jgi:hypothetical protein
MLASIWHNSAVDIQKGLNCNTGRRRFSTNIGAFIVKNFTTSEKPGVVVRAEESKIKK